MPGMKKLQTLGNSAMPRRFRVSRPIAAVIGAAAFLVFSLSGPVFASQGEQRAAARRDSRCDQEGKKIAEQRGGAATDNSANCGKCHDACENGRSHSGRRAVGERSSQELPLDAEGRTTCITCHESRRHAVPAVSGDHLRISNLRRELCLACHRQEIQAGPRVEIISPLDRALVQEERLAFFGRAVRLSGADLAVRINGSEFHLPVSGGEFSTWLTLQAGVNSIDVTQGERLLWSGEIFRGEGALGGYRLASSGHRTGNRAQCRECHLKRDEARPGGAATALCYGCHDRIDEKRYVHGPLAVGDCLVCHDPHSGYGAAHLRQEQESLCGNCHAGQESLARTTCKASGKECVDCHDPHQSDRRYLLRGPQYTQRDGYLARR